MKIFAILFRWPRPSRRRPPRIPRHPAQREPAHIKTDEDIRFAVIKGLLANPNVLAADVRVQVKDNVVTLRGMVRDAEAKSVAAGVARSVPGVREVKNFLEVRPKK